MEKRLTDEGDGAGAAHDDEDDYCVIAVVAVVVVVVLVESVGWALVDEGVDVVLGADFDDEGPAAPSFVVKR